jgi:hypothetical protein
VAAQVHVERAVEGRHGLVQHVAVLVNDLQVRGVGEERVDAAELLHGERHERVHGVFLRDVEASADAGVPCGAQARGKFGGMCGIDVAHHHTRAALDQPLHGGSTNAAAACHHNHFAAQPAHRRFLCVLLFPQSTEYTVAGYNRARFTHHLPRRIPWASACTMLRFPFWYTP